MVGEGKENDAVIVVSGRTLVHAATASLCFFNNSNNNNNNNNNKEPGRLPRLLGLTKLMKDRSRRRGILVAYCKHAHV